MKGSVIIIGAGVSGLYAGTLLEKAGVDYVILEARKEPAVAYFQVRC